MKKIILVLILFVAFGCQAVEETKAQRIDRLGSQLRCPVCRGVPINESPAKLAVQMMAVLKEQIDLGKSDDEIYAFFEQRYGEWVFLKPKAEGVNLMIWVLPLLFIFIGGYVVWRYVRSDVKHNDT